jgi:hypothetical protein
MDIDKSTTNKNQPKLSPYFPQTFIILSQAFEILQTGKHMDRSKSNVKNE